MKIFNLLMLSVLILSINACCSKKGTCPTVEFQSIDLVNFAASEVSDSVELIAYQGGSNFTQIVESAFFKGEATSNPSVFKINTDPLSVNNDYEVKITKLAGKSYKINNYTVDKITCGQCFMRNNNQFGYNLSGYSVNSKHQSYEGTVQILK
ncbi:MAG: hypothetical protein QM530_07190 [Phycisphaerales bacterium]|nr:hypothetical protein [Phycisphaerales bacterium]